MTIRPDETWHRLLEWTGGQSLSERLAAQVLLSEGYADLDPSHPSGGPDGGRDAMVSKGGKHLVMAVYFPRGQQTATAIRSKFDSDLAAAGRHTTDGIVFVTNQEISLSVREQLRVRALPLAAEIYHLDRVATVLDQPALRQVRSQFLHIDDQAESISLGGLGGNAPGAGGGGGGVLGSGTGGTGGRGGDRISLDGEAGKFPGAGGGGQGAIGDGSQGGAGGDGGEMVTGIVDMPEGSRLEIQVGRGGTQGGPGEDTIVHLVDPHGEILQTLTAKGGKAGKPPTYQPAMRDCTSDDIEAGLKVTSIVAAEYIRIQPSGLFSIIEGGWENYRVSTNPFSVRLPLLIEFDTGTLDPGEQIAVDLVVTTPNKFRVAQQKFEIDVIGAPVHRYRNVAVLEFTGSDGGVWLMSIEAADRTIATYPIEVIAPDHTDHLTPH